MSFKENRFVYKSTPDNPSANIAQLFEDTQLSALDSLYDVNPKGIDFAGAEKYLLISAAVRERIKDIPDAEELFKSILAAESEGAGTDEKRRSAFKTAFRKFINKEAFEDETGLDANDPVNKVLLPKLNDVLRSDLSIGDSGFKGRSELQSAARRLRMLLSDEKAEAELSTSKSTLPAKGRKSSSLLAKVKEQTAKEIPGVEADLKDEKEKMAIDEKKVEELEAKLRDLREKDKEYVAWLAEIKEQTRKEITGVEAGLKDGKAKTAEGQKKVDELQAKLNDLREKNKDYVACLARVEKQTGKEIPVVEAELRDEKAKTPVDKKKVDELQLRLNDLRKKDKVYVAWLAKLKEQTGKEIPVVEAELKDEKAKTPVDKKKVDELQAKLNDLREKDSDYVAWLAKVKEQTEKEIPVVEAELKVEKAKTAVGRKKVDGLEVKLNDLQEKDKDYVAWLAKVKEQTEKEIPAVEAELNVEKAKKPMDRKKVDELKARLTDLREEGKDYVAWLAKVKGRIGKEISVFEAELNAENAKTLVDRKKVDGLEARLNDLREKDKDYVAWLAKVREQTEKEVPDVEAELNVEKAKTAVDKRKVDELEEKLAGLRQKETDYVAWIVDKAFRSKKSPSEIKTLERKHTDAKAREDKLKGVSKYFSDGEEVEKIVGANADLDGLMQDGDTAWDKVYEKLKKGKGLHLNGRINALQQAIDSKKASRNNLSDPKGDAMKKEVDAIVNAPNSKIKDRDVARDKILGDYALKRDTLSDEIGEFEGALEPLNQAKEKFKIAKEMIAKLLERLAAAEKTADLKVQFSHGGATYTVDGMATEMKGVKSDPKKLLELYKKFGGFFEPPGTQVDAFLSGFDTKFAEIGKEVSDTKKAWEDAKSDRGQNENHTDHSFAMRVHEAILAEQIAMGIIPDVPLERQSGAAAINLANDIAMIQATEDCEELAKKASPRLLDAVTEANFKQHVVFMRFKNGDKEVEPFRDLKLNVFNNFEKLESLFNTGKLRCNIDKAGGGETTNEVNAFFLLAAFQIMDKDSDKPSKQAVLLERKIKEKLAQRAGLATRMNVAGASKIRDDMFNDQLDLIKPQVEEFFDALDGEPDHGDRSDAKIKELELRHQIIVEENRLAKEKHRFEDDLLEKDDQDLKRKRNELIDEGDKWGIKDRLSFAQQSALMNFVQNSAISHVIGDFGHNLFGLVKGRTEKAAIGAIGMGVRLPLEAANVVAWKTARAGAVVGRSLWEAALTPVRLVRDLGMTGVRVFVPGAKPLSQLKDDVVRDVGAVFSGVKDTSAGMKKVTTAKKANSKSRVAGTWNKSKEAVAGVTWQSKTHKDHTKVDVADLKAKADEFAKKATLPAIEGFEVIEVAKYDERIKQLDGFLKPAVKAAA